MRRLTRWTAARRSSRAARYSCTSLKRPTARRKASRSSGGTLTLPRPTAAVFGSPPSSRACRVDLHDVRSWNMSYGATPAVWVVTSAAWCARRCEGPCVATLVTPVPAGTAYAARRRSTHLFSRQ